MQETQVQSLGWEDPLEKEMATHSTILVWKIPWNWSLAGYGPWDPKESAMTERPTLSFSELVYSVVLITLVHESDCSMYIYIHTYTFHLHSFPLWLITGYEMQSLAVQ